MTTFLQQVAGKAGKAIDVLSANKTTNQFTGLYRLPEFNISERLQSWGGQNLTPTVPTSYAAPQVQGVTTTDTNTGSTNRNVASYSNPYNVSGSQGGQDIINQNAGDQGGNIDQDYESTMSMLGAQESTMRGQSQATEGTLTNEATAVTNQLANQQAVDTQGQEMQLAQGERQGASAMQQARDLFRQTQQNNIAQLSGAGLSSSSVAEALAEKLGVETARRIAGVTGSVQEIRQNATKELSRIKSYYEGKATEVKQWVANEKLKIQNTLNASLDQINAARNQAASAKSQARASLLADVRSQLFTLAQQENQFQQSLQEWAAKKSAATEQLVTDPNLVESYTRNLGVLNQNAGINQNYIGNYGTDSSGNVGYYQGQLKTTKKDEETANPFAI